MPIAIRYLVTSCSCMDDELLKKIELFQNKSSISISDPQACYAKLPSNCNDLIESSNLYGLFTSVEAFCGLQSVTAATEGTFLSFRWIID